MESSYRKSVKARFDVQATTYDSETEWRLDRGILDTVKRFTCGAHEVAVDLGTGTGIVAAETAEYAKAVIGLDLSFEMLKVARRRVPNVVLGNVCQTPFSDEAIDCCTARQLLHYIADHTALIHEIWRIVRPGGVVVLADVVVEKTADLWWWREVKRLVQPLRLRVYDADCHGRLLSQKFKVDAHERLTIWRHDSWDIFLKDMAKEPESLGRLAKLLEMAASGKVSFPAYVDGAGFTYAQTWAITRARRT